MRMPNVIGPVLVGMLFAVTAVTGCSGSGSPGRGPNTGGTGGGGGSSGGGSGGSAAGTGGGAGSGSGGSAGGGRLGASYEPISVSGSKAFDSTVGRSPMAMYAQKVYLTPGQAPGSPPKGYQLIKAGLTTLYVCVKPSTTLTQTNRDALASWVQEYVSYAKAYGTKIKVILWQEPQNDWTHAADFVTYFRYYAPTIRAQKDSNGDAVLCIYDSAGHAGTQAMVDYYPGAAYVDEIMADLYASSYLRKGITGDKLIAQAKADGKPWGWAEIGASLSSWVPTNAEFGQYLSYIQGSIFNLRQAGYATTDVMWYDQPAKNIVNDPASYPQWIPGLQSLYDAMRH